MANQASLTDPNQNHTLMGASGTATSGEETRRVLVDASGNLKVQDYGAYAIKTTETTNVTYVGLAAPGSVQGSAVWAAFKIDETTGLIITWADGNQNFDNVATDLTALSYS